MGVVLLAEPEVVVALVDLERALVCLLLRGLLTPLQWVQVVEQVHLHLRDLKAFQVATLYLVMLLVQLLQQAVEVAVGTQALLVKIQIPVGLVVGEGKFLTRQVQV